MGYLVLSRHRDESIIIGHDIEIRILEVRGDKVRLGVNAPPNISVHRKEVYDTIYNSPQLPGVPDKTIEAPTLSNIDPTSFEPLRKTYDKPNQ